ncbi:MAG: hypothetical protein JWQ25_1959 [Daejeonella sp.]|nr:hypothetical protein [Daejeonella sp.]
MESQFTISSIIFIVLLIVPGIFFKRFYFQGQFTKQFGAGLFADRLITSIFWGLLIQILSFLVFSKAFNFTYNSIRIPLSKAYSEVAKNSLPDFTPKNLGYALGYLLGSISIASFMGALFHRIVRFFKIDVKFHVFRFSNQWDYYIRGDILSTEDFRESRRGKVLSTLVDIVLDGGDGTSKMVSGFLTQYTISAKTGELETIYLTQAKRFSKSSSAFKDVPGDCLIVPYNRVIDLI